MSEEREELIKALERIRDYDDPTGDAAWHDKVRQDIARKALLLTHQETSGWLDISTAPKDGTPFDAWVPDAFGGRRICGLSFNRRGQLRKHGLLTAREMPRWPTHWMPLPLPPTSQETT